MDFDKNIDNRNISLSIDASGISMNSLEGDYLIPPGQISFFATIQAPEGWLICNGQSLNRNDYPDLYNAIGNTWGGNVLNFNLPDFRDCYLRSWDNGRNIDNNRIFGINGFQTNTNKSHQHTFEYNHYHTYEHGEDGAWHSHTIEMFQGDTGQEKTPNSNSASGDGFHTRTQKGSGLSEQWMYDTTLTSDGSNHSHNVKINNVSGNNIMNINFQTIGAQRADCKNIKTLICIKY